ncbi:MAG: capsular exopolysaccharide family [Clostridiales bacterium]|nr:capsular exopolysaccharide family [Clostridiales bacterium]
MKETDLKGLLLIMWRRSRIILLVIILSLGTGFLLTFYVFVPEYETFTTLLIGNPKGYNDKIEYYDVLLSQKLVTTYSEIAKSKAVSDSVIKNLSLDMTYKELRKKVKVTLVGDTEILKIIVTDKSPENAFVITQELTKMFKEHSLDIMKIENIQVIDSPDIPTTPVRPVIWLNLMISAIIGLMTGIFIVILIEFMNTTLKNQADIEKNLGIPLLGQIEKVKTFKTKDRRGKYRSALIRYNPLPSVIEAYRIIRTNIQFLSIGKQKKVIVVTSPSQGEGKSTIAVNLATVISQAGSKCLLIDCDLRKPRVHTYFNLPKEPGLINILMESNEYTYEAIKGICETGISGLDILPTGPIPPDPPEFLGSQNMKQLLTCLREHYDIILVDSPPVGLLTDAAVLATITDGVILVCASNITKVEEAKNALKVLKKVNAVITGVILNIVKTKIRHYKTDL